VYSGAAEAPRTDATAAPVAINSLFIFISSLFKRWVFLSGFSLKSQKLAFSTVVEVFSQIAGAFRPW
jgi:hypothetical protein